MGSYLSLMTATRTRQRFVGAILASVAFGIGSIAFTVGKPIAPARAQERSGNTVRPELGKPIQAALDLLKSKRGKDALGVEFADAGGRDARHPGLHHLDETRGLNDHRSVPACGDEFTPSFRRGGTTA